MSFRGGGTSVERWIFFGEVLLLLLLLPPWDELEVGTMVTELARLGVMSGGLEVAAVMTVVTGGMLVALGALWPGSAARLDGLRFMNILAWNWKAETA